MRKSQLLLPLLSSAVIFGGAFLLDAPPAEAAELSACNDAQRAYARNVAFSVCGSTFKFVIATCDGANVTINEIRCR